MAHYAGNTQGHYRWHDPLKGVYFGPGCVNEVLPLLLDKLGAKKALIITGKSLNTKTDIVRRVEGILKERNAFAATFDEIGQHSPISGILKAKEIFKANGCDIIVAVGGGSPIDASKAVLFKLHEDTGGPFMRQIAIPTTLSAAEYTIGAGFKDESGNKTGVADPQISPAGIILDAELTLPTPERLWLSTGMRALDHAVESLYRPVSSPPQKVLAYAAIADLFELLPKSKADPSDVEVRQRLQIASWMSLWPLTQEKRSPLGLSHSLGHKLGAAYEIPHGITSCLTLSKVVNLKSETLPAPEKEALAHALFGLRQPSTGSVEGDIRKLSRMIDELVQGLGLRSSLDGKVPKSDVPKIAGLALGSQEHPEYQRVVAILESLYTSSSSL